MSTDIGALQRQYKTLQQKQHQACVVLSGMGHQNSDSVPNSPDSSIKETDYLNNSLSLMTLSVTMDTEKVPQKTSEAVSPMAFGKTKCIFVQNSTKKHQWKNKNGNHKTRHHKFEMEKLEEENSGVSPADDSELLIKDNSDQIEVIHEGQKGENGNDDVEEHENAVGGREDCKGAACVKEHITESGGREINENDTGQPGKKEGRMYDNNDVVDEEDDAVFVKNKTYEVDHISSEGGAKNNENTVAGDREGINTVSNEAILNKEACGDNKVAKSSDNKADSECKVKDPYRPYYPLKIIKPSSKRHSSVKMANKQSIYQHFNMTKRQLSLDSALEECAHTNKSKYSADFPFPIHSINQHKIQAGMKLGLYDQNALKKLETLKPRKCGRKRLPSLNVD